MGEPIKDFTELRVYQTAFESAMDIFHLAKKWPSDEKFSLISQIRNSSRSINANLAEGLRKRRYPGAFVSKLSDADSESAETRVWLAFANRCGYLPKDEYAKLNDVYDHVCAQLALMMQHPEKWCIKD